MRAMRRQTWGAMFHRHGSALFRTVLSSDSAPNQVMNTPTRNSITGDLHGAGILSACE
jgi:hypothetical protein